MNASQQSEIDTLVQETLQRIRAYGMALMMKERSPLKGVTTNDILEAFAESYKENKGEHAPADHLTDDDPLALNRHVALMDHVLDLVCDTLKPHLEDECRTRTQNERTFKRAEIHRYTTNALITCLVRETTAGVHCLQLPFLDAFHKRLANARDKTDDDAARDAINGVIAGLHDDPVVKDEFHKFTEAICGGKYLGARSAVVEDLQNLVGRWRWLDVLPEKAQGSFRRQTVQEIERLFGELENDLANGDLKSLEDHTTMLLKATGRLGTEHLATLEKNLELRKEIVTLNDEAPDDQVDVVRIIRSKLDEFHSGINNWIQWQQFDEEFRTSWGIHDIDDRLRQIEESVRRSDKATIGNELQEIANIVKPLQAGWLSEQLQSLQDNCAVMEIDHIVVQTRQMRSDIVDFFGLIKLGPQVDVLDKLLARVPWRLAYGARLPETPHQEERYRDREQNLRREKRDLLVKVVRALPWERKADLAEILDEISKAGLPQPNARDCGLIIKKWALDRHLDGKYLMKSFREMVRTCGCGVRSDLQTRYKPCRGARPEYVSQAFLESLESLLDGLDEMDRHAAYFGDLAKRSRLVLRWMCFKESGKHLPLSEVCSRVTGIKVPRAPHPGPLFTQPGGIIEAFLSIVAALECCVGELCHAGAPATEGR